MFGFVVLVLLVSLVPELPVLPLLEEPLIPELLLLLPPDEVTSSRSAVGWPSMTWYEARTF